MPVARALRARPCPRLFARWLSSAERAAYIARCAPLLPGPAAPLILDPGASHIPPMWSALSRRLGADATRWPSAAIRDGVRAYLARQAPPAAVEIAEWWRFMARVRRRPAWARLAVRIEIDRWSAP